LIHHNNNFDLIRLFAASQVFVQHLYIIVDVNFGGVINSISHFWVIFPGVPIFFFVSGYLISQSYENSKNIKDYAIKRILRIYPALIFSVILGVILITASGYLYNHNVSIIDWVVLGIAKSTIFQFYNPEFLREYGDGVFNGNLWTITVELQFYVLIVILYMLQKKLNVHRMHFWIIILFLSIVLNRFYMYFRPDHASEIWFKLYGVSFAPWFYMFVLGVIAQCQKTFFLYYIERYSTLFVLSYIFIALAVLRFKLLEFGNHISLLLSPLLFLTVLCMAYSIPSLSHKILRGQDISYGIYLYHMLIINYFLYHYGKAAHLYALVIILLVIVISLASWFLIEKYMIKFK
jgi:peptidoglycan/LPS O-acetylase OafA/YrhL